MNEPARIPPTQEVFVPRWLQSVWHEMVAQRYTGPLTLHFSEGRVQKIEDRRTRKPQEIRD